MADEDYIAKKIPGRVYVSSEIDTKTARLVDGAVIQIERKGRYVDTALEDSEGLVFGVVEKEITLRPTPSGRRQIKLFIITDPRQIRTLTLQSFSIREGLEQPSKTAHFTLVGEEIKELLKIAHLAVTRQFGSAGKIRLDSKDLAGVELTADAARSLVGGNQALLEQIIRHELTERDIVAVAFRKKQLQRFELLLKDSSYFEKERVRCATGPEQLWQMFFEENQWIFGGALFLTSTSSIDTGKLERAVVGASVSGPGKRADALMRTRGRIGALCFVEIKCHTTKLLKDKPYRPGVWAASDDLVGAIAQVQKTVELAENTIKRVLRPKDELGNPISQEAFLLRPRSVVVCGDLEQFKTDAGVNEEKFASFELFRRQIVTPDVVTFDELLERARLIVEISE